MRQTNKTIGILLTAIILGFFIGGQLAWAQTEHDFSQEIIVPLPTPEEFEAARGPIKINPPMFRAYISPDMEIKGVFKIENASNSDFSIQEMRKPEWIAISEPATKKIQPNGVLTIPYSVDVKNLPLGTTTGSIEIVSEKGTQLFPIEITVQDNEIVVPSLLPADTNYPQVDAFIYQNGEWVTVVTPPSGDYCCDSFILSLNTNHYAYISPSGDIDFWKFFPDQVADYRIILDVPTGNEYDLVIYGGCSSSTPATCNEIGWIQYCATSGDESCVFTPFASQYYYVIAYGRNGSNNPSVPYGLSISYDCTNQCSFVGQTQCSGNYSQTCGNYDADICLEWNAGTYCPNACNGSTGQCNTCTSHSYSQCYNNDRYWYNSCGAREDLRQDCGDTTYGSNYCSNDDVYRNVTDRWCSSDVCNSNSYPQLVQECGVAGCNPSTSQCNVCTPHSSIGCFNNDAYWHNSCGQVEDLYQDCRVSCQSAPDWCNDGLLGNFAVKVKNEQGTPEQNATVSFKRQGSATFQFAGATNSQGILLFSDLWPNEETNIRYEIKVVSANGSDCGTQATTINNEGDTDTVMFRCPIANNNNYLRIQPSGPETINLGQSLQLNALIRDLLSAPISQALVGLIRPYSQTPLSGFSDGAGNVSFQDTGVPAGTHNFQFIASKPNYHYAEAWKKVTVKPQQIPIAVKDRQGKPVNHATIKIGAQTIGFTDSTGKLFVDVNQPINTFHALNTDDIDCGYRTVQVGEQANFVCPKNPQLKVAVDNIHGLPLVNVGIGIDNDFVDFTNAFGFEILQISSGQHAVQIYYKTDENSQIFVQEQVVAINSSFQTLQFIADESLGLPLTDQNGPARAIPAIIVAAVAAINAVLDPISIPLDIESICSCMARNSFDQNFAQDCVQVLTACLPNNLNYCQENLNLSPTVCPVEYGSLFLDLGPMTGVGIANKIGIGAPIVALANKFNVEKIIDPAINLFKIVKRQGENYWIAIGHEWNYVVRKISDGIFTFQIKFQNGIELGTATSYAINTSIKNPIIGKQAGETGAYMLRDFGDYTDEFARVKAYALVRESKTLGASGWTQVQKRGLHSLTDKYPAVSDLSGNPLSSQIDGVLTGFSHSDLPPTAVQEAIELNPNGTLRNFVKEPYIGSRQVDGKFTIGGIDRFVESSSLEGTLQTTWRLEQKIVEESQHFEFAEAGLDATINIKLESGMSPALNMDIIRTTISNLFQNPPPDSYINKITRIQIFDVTTLEVINVTGG